MHKPKHSVYHLVYTNGEHEIVDKNGNPVARILDSMDNKEKVELGILFSLSSVLYHLLDEITLGILEYTGTETDLLRKKVEIARDTVSSIDLTLSMLAAS